MEESKTKNQTYDPDWLQGMNERDNFEAHYKKSHHCVAFQLLGCGS